MSKNLVIVESPAKAKTLAKYLGKDFSVLASVGHVRDILNKTGSVDPGDSKNNFSIKFKVDDKKKKVLKDIKQALKKAETLYLATDPDREGEAISWHLLEIFEEEGLIQEKPVHRVVFYEVTKDAVIEAFKSPKQISAALVDAYLARRVIDYLFGFNLSPLLWKKIKYGLSAGRVQSPALRMIVEREKQIDDFEKQEYWTIDAKTQKEKHTFSAKLTHYKNKKIKKFDIDSEKNATKIREDLTSAAKGVLVVQSVERKERRRNPVAPFTTSTLQQEASRKLGFNARRTMGTAQGLYMGVDTGEGEVGLISYHRTDSVNLSNDAIEQIRALVAERYGPEMLPDDINTYKTKSRNAQEAHEAIRPTSLVRTPEDMKGYLTDDQYALYDLIWKRAVASQMTHATLDLVTVNFDCGDTGVFRANGSQIKHPGFMKVYLEGTDEKETEVDEKLLPDMKEGEKVKLLEICPEQHFTEPPPRYNTASLIKLLEEYGIGRPSTYANIISTLQDREYVELEGRAFVPTDMGIVVTHFLTTHLSQYVDYEYTAALEEKLDIVSRGESKWAPVVNSFWKDFGQLIEQKEKTVTREEAIQERVLGKCPKTGRPVSVRVGRYGPYIMIGHRDDEEKPKYAGLRPKQKMAEVTFEDAMELFKLPRYLGETEEGERVETNFGRFGPYVKFDSKFVSTKGADPFMITLEEAIVLIKEKKELDANRIIQEFKDTDIQVLNGRYGPYVTNGKKNVKCPAGREPAELTLEECEELIAKAPVRKKRRRSAKKKASG
jgi:DNA topoisomerase-1